MDLCLKCRAQRSDSSSRRYNHVSFTRLVLNREFQFTCLALTLPTIQSINPPWKQAVRYAPISGRKNER